MTVGISSTTTSTFTSASAVTMRLTARYGNTVPFFSLHSFSVRRIHPLPLQSLVPAQDESAPPQAPLPLHSFTPEQRTWAVALSFFLGAGALSPAASIIATSRAVFIQFGTMVGK